MQVKLGDILTMKKEIENNLSNLDKLCGKKKSATPKEPDMEAQIRSGIEKNLTIKDYEAIYPKTIGYIKANIYHGYDSMYYVLNKNKEGYILPLEYNDSSFKSTFHTRFI